MKNIEKRKILRFVIFALCMVIFAGAFLILRNWFHSDGMHFIGSYGQVHMSQVCEGIDQDGNKMESRNMIVDGVITRNVITGNRKFSGEINIDDLPEINGLFAVTLCGVIKQDNGLYELGPCIFSDPSPWEDPTPWDKVSDDEELNDKSCVATVWIKANQVAMEFYDFNNEKYYIFYSDEEMLNIEELRTKPPEIIWK